MDWIKKYILLLLIVFIFAPLIVGSPWQGKISMEIIWLPYNVVELNSLFLNSILSIPRLGSSLIFSSDFIPIYIILITPFLTLLITDKLIKSKRNSVYLLVLVIVAIIIYLLYYIVLSQGVIPSASLGYS